MKEPGGLRLVCLCLTADASPQRVETLRQRVQQAFVICAVFDPLRVGTYEASLSLLQDIALPAIKETQSPELPPTQVFLIENNWGASSNRGVIQVDVQAARDTGKPVALSLSCPLISSLRSSLAVSSCSTSLSLPFVSPLSSPQVRILTLSLSSPSLPVASPSSCLASPSLSASFFTSCFGEIGRGARELAR